MGHPEAPQVPPPQLCSPTPSLCAWGCEEVSAERAAVPARPPGPSPHTCTAESKGSHVRSHPHPAASPPSAQRPPHCLPEPGILRLSRRVHGVSTWTAPEGRTAPQRPPPKLPAAQTPIPGLASGAFLGGPLGSATAPRCPSRSSCAHAPLTSTCPLTCPQTDFLSPSAPGPSFLGARPGLGSCRWPDLLSAPGGFPGHTDRRVPCLLAGLLPVFGTGPQPVLQQSSRRCRKALESCHSPNSGSSATLLLCSQQTQAPEPEPLWSLSGPCLPQAIITPTRTPPLGLHSSFVTWDHDVPFSE